MPTQIKEVLHVLTTQRDALDRAITALAAVTNGRAPTGPVQPTATRRRRKTTRVHLNAEEKRACVVGMRLATGFGEKQAAAERLARQFGASPNTITCSWITWEKSAKSNGAIAATNLAADVLESGGPI